MFVADMAEGTAMLLMANRKYLEVSVYLPLRWKMFMDNYIELMRNTGPYRILVEEMVGRCSQ